MQNRDRHQDLVLVLEGEISLKRIADSYFLFDFFEFEENAFKKDDDIPAELTKALIQYWLQRFLSMEEGMSRFFPFDLSDQYILGLLIEKELRGNKLQIVWSPEIGGFGINQPQLDSQLTQLSEGLKVLDPKDVFYFTDFQIVGGLKESLAELKPSFSKKENPILPDLQFPEEQTEWLIQEIDHGILIYNPFGYGGALQRKETVYFTYANPEGDLNYFELKNGEWKQVPEYFADIDPPISVYCDPPC